MSKSGYFVPKSRNTTVRTIKVDTTLEEHKDEAVTVTTLTGCTSQKRVTLLPAVPGRVFRAEQSTACRLVVVPASGEKLSLHTGVLQSADTAITSEVVGAKIELMCKATGEWECSGDKTVGIWQTA